MKVNKYNLYGLLILGFLVFATSLGIVVASTDDGDGIDDDFEDSKRRSLGIEIETDRIEIESILVSGTQKNKIEFEIRNDTNGAEFKIEFTPNYEPSSNESHIELEFEVTFKEIVEYIDLNLNGVFDELVDTEIQVLSLNSFQTTEYTLIDLSPDTQMHYFIVRTTDNVFAVHAYFVEEFEIVNGTLITPSETKIDIEISNFNYLQSNTRLALYTKLESELSYEEKNETEDEEHGYADDEQGVFTLVNNHIGFFTWKENATVDDVSKEVLISDILDDDIEPNEQKIFMNYPNGTLIYHDPKIGVEGLSVSAIPAQAIPGFEIITLLAVSLVGVFALIYAYKKKQKA
ncbi:MAG: hypothetical protein ACTSQW_02965 [Promethearchaeota archaeon]